MSADRLVAGFLGAAGRSSDGSLDASGLDHRSLNEDRCGGDPILSAGFCRRLSARRLHHQRAVVCIKTWSIFAAGLVVTAFSVPAEADVWEFDRQGNVLVSPNQYHSQNDAYVTNVTSDMPGPAVSGPAVRSSRSSPNSAHSAIYRPMAEGVAAVYAADPAVADAGLSPAQFVRVFVALIDQESRFNPQALSPKGARGLGQLMPQTAAELGVADPGEPMANLHGAARYLTAQLGAFGRLDYALAAYNAGPHRITQYGGVPPFRETRNYVARITAAAAVAGGSAGLAAEPIPENSRASSAELAPQQLQPEFIAAEDLAATPINHPVQGTVLEWTK